jgi:hypothetical protein
MGAATLKAGADASVTVRLENRITSAITMIDEDAWTPIESNDALYDEGSRTWISRAEVAEIPFIAVASQKKTNHVPGRLVVRRIPHLNPSRKNGQGTLFDTWRSTRSSPPPPRLWPARWPRIRPIAVTRTSSRSTPT